MEARYLAWQALHKMGPQADPALQATVAAVIANPWLGTGPSRDLSPEVTRIAPVLAQILSDRLVAALGGVEAVEAFAPAAAVAIAGGHRIEPGLMQCQAGAPIAQVVQRHRDDGRVTGPRTR